MRKKFLTRLNFVLGALSVGLAGCSSSKKAVAAERPPIEPRKYGPPSEMVVEEKYGIPMDILDEPLEEPVQKPDTIIREPEPEPEPVLYGPPYGLWDDPEPLPVPAPEQAPINESEKSKKKSKRK